MSEAHCDVVQEKKILSPIYTVALCDQFFSIRMGECAPVSSKQGYISYFCQSCVMLMMSFISVFSSF